MAAVTVRASSGGVVTGVTNTLTITFPGTPQTNDPVGIWLTTDNSGQTITTPSGWTVAYTTNVVNGSRAFLHKLYASTDGTSVAITTSANLNVAWVCAVLDGSVHADFGTLGTITTRGSSVTTATAVATGSSAVPNLVVFHEKSSSHATGPTISPTTTTIQSQWSTVSGGASTYLGTYDDSGGTADRTATYSVASTNACGYQIPVTAAVTIPPTAFPQSGAVAPTTAQVLYATTHVTSARVAYATNSGLTSPSYSGTLTADSDGIVSAALSGLTANTVYYYGIEADGVLLSTGRGQFRTYPTAGSQASGTFLFGSCQLTDSNHAVFDTIRTHSTPHTNYGFFHVGDLHYRDWMVNGISDAPTIKAQQKSSTQQTKVAALLAAYPWVYTWDNHDYGGADSDGTEAAAPVLAAMYRQMVPHYPLPTDTSDNTGAIDQTWAFGRVSFFMLDTRSQRSPSTATDNSSKSMLGAGQKTRMKAWMADTTYPFKVLVCGIPYKNYGGPGGTGDRWGAYLTEFAELATYFAASGYGSLFCITGDIHRNAADDGTNESYGHVPNFVASPFDQSGSEPVAAAWSQGYYPATSGPVTSHNFAQLDLTDNGTSIVMAATGYDNTDTANITLTRTFSFPPNVGTLSGQVPTPTGTAAGTQTVPATLSGQVPLPTGTFSQATPRVVAVGASFSGATPNTVPAPAGVVAGNKILVGVWLNWPTTTVRTAADVTVAGFTNAGFYAQYASGCLALWVGWRDGVTSEPSGYALNATANPGAVGMAEKLQFPGPVPVGSPFGVNGMAAAGTSAAAPGSVTLPGLTPTDPLTLNTVFGWGTTFPVAVSGGGLAWHQDDQAGSTTSWWSAPNAGTATVAPTFSPAVPATSYAVAIFGQVVNGAVLGTLSGSVPVLTGSLTGTSSNAATLSAAMPVLKGNLSATILVTNNAEGGTNGTTVNTGNSGGASGTAFSTVNFTGTGVLAFQNTQAAHGTMSYRATAPPSSRSSMRLDGAVSSTSYAARFYMNVNSALGSNGQQFLTMNQVVLCSGATNQVKLLDSGGTTVKLFSPALSAGVWYRLEVEATAGTTTTNGYLAARFFVGDSTTPVDQFTSSVANTGTTPFTNVIFGPNVSAASTTFDVWLDDLAVANATVAPIGPAANPASLSAAIPVLTGAVADQAATILVTNNAEGGSNGTTVTTGNSGGGSGTAFSTVFIGASATATFDTAQAAHGTLSYHLATTANFQPVYVALPGAATSKTWATRFSIRFNTLPSSNYQILLNMNNGPGWRIAGTNQFALEDQGGSSVKTFTTVITTGVWYRLEMECDSGTTGSNGYIAGRVFLGDATTPVEAAYSSSVQNAGSGATFSAVEFGLRNATSLFYDVWLDDLAIANGTTTPIGPAANSASLSGAIPVLTGTLAGTVVDPASLSASTPVPTGTLTGTASNAATLTGFVPVLTGAVADQAAASNIGTLSGDVPVLTGQILDVLPITGTLSGKTPVLTGVVRIVWYWSADQAAQTAGTVITAANSGGGTNIALASAQISGSPTYATDNPFKASQSAKMPATTGTSNKIGNAWTASSVIALRFYVCFPSYANPTAGFQLAQWSGGNNFVGVSGSGKLFISLNSVTVRTTTPGVATNTWYWVSVYSVIGTAGTFAYEWHLASDDSLIDSYTPTPGTTNTGTTASLGDGFGKLSNSGNFGAILLDHIEARVGADVVGLIGPWVPPGAATLSGSVPLLTGALADVPVVTTGTLSGSTPVLTGVASGTATDPGTASGSSPVLTGTLTEVHPATLAGSVAVLTGSVAGTVVVPATLAGAVPNLMGPTVGTQVDPGTVSGATPTLTGPTVGTQVDPGTVSGSVLVLTSGFTAAQADPATLSGQVPVATGTLSAAQADAAALSGAVPLPTTALTGAATVTGSLTASVPVLTGAAAGTLAESGTLSGKLPVLAGFILDQLVNITSIDAAVPLLTGLLSGTQKTAGTLSGSTPVPTGATLGIATDPATVSGQVPVPSGALTGVGVVPNPATLSGAVPVAAGAFTGTPICPAVLSGATPLPTGSLSGTPTNPVILSGSTVTITGTITGTARNAGTASAATPLLTGSLTGAGAISATLSGTVPVLTGTLPGIVFAGIPAVLAGSVPLLTGSSSAAMVPSVVLLIPTTYQPVTQVTSTVVVNTGTCFRHVLPLPMVRVWDGTGWEPPPTPPVAPAASTSGGVTTVVGVRRHVGTNPINRYRDGEWVRFWTPR